MNFRLTAILFGLVLVLGVGLLVMTWTGDEPGGEGVLEELAGVKAEQVDTVEIERAEPAGKLVFKRSGKDKWEIVEPYPARADANAVNGVVTSLLRAKPIPYAEMSGDPTAHGLAPAGLKVTLRKGDKASTLNLGNVTIGGPSGVVFVTTSARPKRPMAVSRGDLETLFKGGKAEGGKATDLAKWTTDYRTKGVFTIDPRAAVAGQDVAAVTLTARGKTLGLAHATDGSWTFTSPAGWGDADAGGDPMALPGTFTGVSPLLSAVTNLSAVGPDDIIEAPADLKEYGLNADNPDRVRVELTMKDGTKEAILIGRKDAPAVPAVTPPAPGTQPPPPPKVFVQIEGQAGVIKANATTSLDNLATVIADPAPLRNRTLLAADKGRIDAIDVTVPGQPPVKLRKAPGGFSWVLVGNPGDPTEANMKVVDDLLTVLAEPRTVKDFPAPNDANFAGAENKGQVQVWVEGIDPAAPTPAAPNPEPKLKAGAVPITLQFGKADATGIFVRRTLANGTRADFVLPEKIKMLPDGTQGVTVLAAVRKTRLETLSTSLRNFNAGQAAKITLQLGGTVTEVVLSDKPDPAFVGAKWTYLLPAAVKDRVADAEAVTADLVTPLALLTPTTYVSETPTPAEAAAWGLAGPTGARLKVTVTMRATPPPIAMPGQPAPPPPPPPAAVVYEFGNETPDKLHVFARVEGKPAVFTVPVAIFNKLAAPDLRDRQVLRFDPAKVQRIEFRGWKEQNNVLMTLTLKREGGVWVALAPAGYGVDSGKVEEFLQTLRRTRAKTFVGGTVLRPEQGFNNDRMLEIGVILDTGERNPQGAIVERRIGLTLGADADNATGFYGWSSEITPADNPFITDRAPLLKYKTAFGVFGK